MKYRFFPIYFILLCLQLTAQEELSWVDGFHLPDEVFHFHINDFNLSDLKDPEEVLKSVLWTPEEDVEGELLDRAEVYWKYYRIPPQEEFQDDDSSPLDVMSLVVESFETNVQVYYNGHRLFGVPGPNRNRMGFQHYILENFREGDRLYFRIISNPHAGEEIYLTRLTDPIESASRFTLMYLYREYMSILFSFFSFSAGLFMLILFLLRFRRNEKFLLWFALFSISYSLYSLFDTNIVNVLFAIPPLYDFYIPLLAQDLMPAFLLLFYLYFMGDKWRKLLLLLAAGQLLVLTIRLLVMLTGLFSEWSDQLSLFYPVLTYIAVSLHLILKQRSNIYSPFFFTAFIILGTAYLLQMISEVNGIFGDFPLIIGPRLFFITLGILPIYSYFRQEAFIRKQNRTFFRFVPGEFLTFLDKKDITDVALGDQTEKNLTILFTDIRSFTTLSEKMGPEENFAFLNRYLKAMGPIVRENGGFIDKYIGDAVMALFPGKPGDAVRTGLMMLEKLDSLNIKWKDKGYPDIKIGIGIHTGRAMLGILGEAERYQGTVISDAVNLASRLESLTKKTGYPILLSEETWLRTKDEFDLKYLGSTRVKGKTVRTKVYTLEKTAMGIR